MFQRAYPLFFVVRIMKFTLDLFSLVVYTTTILAQGAPPGIYMPAARNFTQKLNHDSNDSITFQQLYQLDTSNFKPGGPILFHQGEEGAMKPIAAKIFSDYGPKLGGIVATLEHRFFGTSYPEGTSWENTSMAQYGPLTLENVLQDSVTFVNWIKKTVDGAENSKVIISGGQRDKMRSLCKEKRTKLTIYRLLRRISRPVSFNRPSGHALRQ